MKPADPPYLGAAYYPELWPLEQMDEDIALMKDVGINVVRLGESAWSKIEPREGEFDFGWLHMVVEKLADSGIATILCTPSSAPPLWLVENYPDVLFTHEDGGAARHGARRHACPNNPTFRRFCTQIVTQLANEFGNDDRVVGWQIDNEVAPPTGADLPCTCPTCVRRFQDKMRQRYGSIETLNDIWGTGLWSQTYASFEQLPAPDKKTNHHPSLLTAWSEFMSDSYVDFVNEQAEALHRLATQPIGTDMPASFNVDLGEINKALDVVQFNHSNNAENLWEAAFWCDAVRSLKDAPFWNMETPTSWAGSTSANGYREPGFCRANSWIPIAMGAEANLYSLWRQHWSGQVSMHGAVVSTAGRPFHMIGEVQEVASGLANASEFLKSTKVKKSAFAMHFSHKAAWMFEHQPISDGFDYHRMLLERAYRPMIQVHLRPDLILPSADISDYRMIFTPFLPALDEGGLRERIGKWVEEGGIWVVGPLTDIRTLDATKFTHAPYGSLEELAGVYCRYELPGQPHDFNLRWTEEKESLGSIWYDVLESNGAVIVAEYADGPLAGLGAVTQMPVGMGRIVMLGTMPQPEDLQALLISYANEAGIQPVADASDNLLVIPREGEDGEGLIAVEVENRLGGLALSRPMTDILTGVVHEGIMTVDPYAVMILR